MTYKAGDLVLRVGLAALAEHTSCHTGNWTPGRIYVVEEDGDVRDDTNFKFSGPELAPTHRFNEFVSFDQLLEEALKEDFQRTARDWLCVDDGFTSLLTAGHVYYGRASGPSGTYMIGKGINGMYTRRFVPFDPIYDEALEENVQYDLEHITHGYNNVSIGLHGVSAIWTAEANKYLPGQSICDQQVYDPGHTHPGYYIDPSQGAHQHSHTISDPSGGTWTVPALPTPSGSVAGSILTEAADIVGGARNTTHGDKERSFQAIAGLWNAYLDARKDSPVQAPGSQITAIDVSWMMVLLKAARSVQGQPVRDHFVDAAGYAAICGELSA